jgi:hypothetical protein
MKHIRIFLICILGTTILFGCSKAGSPVAPNNGNPGNSGYPDISKHGMAAGLPSGTLDSQLTTGSFLHDSSGLEASPGHQIMGIWRIRLYDDGRCEVYPERTVESHNNVTSIVKNCSTCMKIKLGPPPGAGLFDFNITLTNPTNIAAYDVTGIIRISGDITFVNPDSYTFLWSYPGDTTPNPYAAWATGVDKRKFDAHASNVETLRFHKGGITKFTEMDYVIQASHPSNQEEPYEIGEMTASSELQSNGSNTADLSCRVGDWQLNVDSVTIDLTPIGGQPNTPMTFVSDNIWNITGVSYSATGQGAGDHLLKITATSNGVSTYNYLPVKVIANGPIKDGPFEVSFQNLPVGQPDGPTDGMDIAVIGATDGTSTGMVFGNDDTYHFWTTNYSDGTFGLYNNVTGLPITPFDLPNSKFDFADAQIPDTSVDSIFSLSWGEVNASTAILDPATIPPVKNRDRLALWWLNDGNLKLTSNVFVLGKKPGPPITFDVIVRPIDIASGFNHDGFLYVAQAFSAGDDTKFPIIDIMSLHPPLDFAGNTTMISDGYEIALDEGSGPGVVNRDALVGIDVDDSNILPISGGYGGHAWAAAVEAGVENALEIVDADIDLPKNTFVTVGLPSAPKDVEILPLKKAGQPSNWIAVLCTDNKIRLYDYTGALKQTIGGSPFMVGSALRLDIDDEHNAIHVLHQGSQGPLVTVYKWVG